MSSDVKVTLSDVWFDSKGNPQFTVQYEKEETFVMEVDVMAELLVRASKHWMDDLCKI